MGIGPAVTSPRPDELVAFSKFYTPQLAFFIYLLGKINDVFSTNVYTNIIENSFTPFH